jgi:hypothetical protein
VTRRDCEGDGFISTALIPGILSDAGDTQRVSRLGGIEPFSMNFGKERNDHSKIMNIPRSLGYFRLLRREWQLFFCFRPEFVLFPRSWK